MIEGMTDLSLSAFDRLPTQIAVLDLAGSILYVNAAWDDFARDNGYDGPNFLGMNYLGVCQNVTGVEAGQSGIFVAGVRAVASGEQTRFKMVYPCHAPNEKRWFKGFAYRHGECVAVMHVDISEEYEEFERLSGFLGRAELIHDLRSPLNAIIGFSQLGPLYDATKLEKIRESFAMIHQGGERMLELVNDLLAYVKGASEERGAREEDVRLSELVGGIVRECQILADGADVTLSAEVPVDLLLLGNGKELHKVFVNLISNAIKYNRQDGEVHVSATLNTAGGIEVQIADTGMGIPKGQHEAVFEPFHRVADTGFVQSGDEEKEGTGLGLAICRDVARLHDGDVVLESELGQGSTFTVRFPSWRTR